MKRTLLTGTFLGVLLLSGSLLAQQGSAQLSAGTTKKSAPAPSAQASGASKVKTAAPSEVPKDPTGVRGISPFWEEVVAGDAAVIAIDYESATTHYQAAITSEPKNPVGHLRMAELSLKQRNLPEAEEYIQSAIRFAGEDIRTHAQALLMLAGVKEVQHDADGALNAYADYKALDSQLPAQPAPDAKKAEEPSKGPKPPVIYVETADLRTAAIQARKKLEEDYAQVVERIRKNVEAADNATGAGAGK